MADDMTSPAPQEYSIRVASRMTGISPHTLRMWERRYGFPEPTRTEGGARRYSGEDVERLKLIARALEAGYRAGEVVGKDRKELEDIVAVQIRAGVTSDDAPTVDGLLDLVERDNAGAVREQLRRAVAVLGPRRFLMQFADPLSTEVGKRWERGSITIAQEHLTTEALTSQLHTLIGSFENVRGRPTVLLTTLPEERHGLGLLMVSLYLALNGAVPHMLGVHTPVAEIVQAAVRLDVDVVGISSSSAQDPKDATVQLRQLLKDLPRRMELWLGGRGAQKLSLKTNEDVILVPDWESLDESLARWRAVR